GPPALRAVPPAPARADRAGAGVRRGAGRRGLGAEDTAADDAVDCPGLADQRAAGVPEAAAGPAGLAEPQRGVAVRRDELAGQPTDRAEPGRVGPGAVPGRVGAVRDPAARGPDVVPADLHGADHLVRPPGAAQLRRGDVAGHGVGQRAAGRHPQRRVRPVLLRRHRRPALRHQRGHRRRVRPGGQRRLPDRQAAQGRQRHLLHRRQRHLADRLAGAHPGRPGHPAGHHAGRPGGRARPGRPGRGRRHGDRPGAQRRHGRRHRLRRGRRAPADPGAVRPPVVAHRPVPVRPPGHAQRWRRGHRLLRDALGRQGRRRRRPPPGAERQVRLQPRHPGPGLLAGRHPHRADRRGAALRPGAAEGARLQHGAQAHQGGAGPLVLLGGPARPDGVAGHAVHAYRRHPVRVRPGQLRVRAAPHGRPAARDHLDRAVGPVQRGLGRVRPGADRGPGQELGPDPAGEQQLRLQLLRLRRWQRRRHRRPHLRRSGQPAAAVRDPGRHARRVRRARAAGRRARVEPRQRLRVRDDVVPGRPHRAVRPGHHRGRSADRVERPVRLHLHPADRRGERGQRPVHVRPAGAEGGRGPGPRGQRLGARRGRRHRTADRPAGLAAGHHPRLHRPVTAARRVARGHLRGQLGPRQARRDLLGPARAVQRLLLLLRVAQRRRLVPAARPVPGPARRPGRQRAVRRRRHLVRPPRPVRRGDLAGVGERARVVPAAPQQRGLAVPQRRPAALRQPGQLRRRRDLERQRPLVAQRRRPAARGALAAGHHARLHRPLPAAPGVPGGHLRDHRRVLGDRQGGRDLRRPARPGRLLLLLVRVPQLSRVLPAARQLPHPPRRRRRHRSLPAGRHLLRPAGFRWRGAPLVQPAVARDPALRGRGLDRRQRRRQPHRQPGQLRPRHHLGRRPGLDPL
ncbi:MAG: GH2 / CBM42 / GH43_23, partial [uncultured Corynebacteriales bacterium]